MQHNIFLLLNRVNDDRILYENLEIENSFIIGDGAKSSFYHNLIQLESYVKNVRKFDKDAHFTVFMNAHGATQFDESGKPLHKTELTDSEIVQTQNLVEAITYRMNYKPYDLVVINCEGKGLISQLNSNIMPAGSQVLIFSEADKNTYGADAPMVMKKHFSGKTFTAKELYEKYLPEIVREERPVLYTIEEEGAQICLPMKGSNLNDKLDYLPFSAEQEYLKSEFLKLYNFPEAEAHFYYLDRIAQGKSLVELPKPNCERQDDLINFIVLFQAISKLMPLDKELVSKAEPYIDMIKKAADVYKVQIVEKFFDKDVLEDMMYAQLYAQGGDQAVFDHIAGREIARIEVIEQHDDSDQAQESESCNFYNSHLFSASSGELYFTNAEMNLPNPYGFFQWASYKLGELRAELAAQNDDGYQCLVVNPLEA